MRVRSKLGFTLIELMVVVAILGVLAAMAGPSFSIYMKRSKSAEAPAQLKALFNRVNYYYQRESADPGLDGAHRVNCIVGPVHNDVTPSAERQTGDYTAAAWRDLAYAYAAGYYRYEVVNAGGRCHVSPNESSVYTLRAVGDLDGDATLSTFDLAVGSNEENELYHARMIYVVDGYE